MPAIIKTNDELIKETIEETSKKVANEIFEKLNSTTPSSGSKIAQILKNAKTSTTQQQTQTHTEEDEEKKKKEEKEKIDKEKAEKEKLEKEKDEREKSLKEEKEKLEETKKKEREEFDKEKEKLHKELEESEVYCPTCSSHKHEHKLKKTGNGKMKCVGDKCGVEYSLVPNNADYVCTTCGLPHKKPAEAIDDDNCPFCGNDEFLKHDWSRVLTKNKKSVNK